MVLVIQVLILAGMLALVVAWAIRFPYPAAWLRPFLRPRLRWPERQIRSWLRSGRFHPGFLAFFNRDPDRSPPAAPGLVAPADGIMTSADERDGIRYLVIALSFWDMHVQRCPVAARVTAIESAGDTLMDGEGRDFAFLREKHRPVQTRVVLQSEQYGQLAVRLITSVAARRIEVWPQVGATLARGQRLGRILLGSTVVLEMPTNFALQVASGQRVRAAETVVATSVAP